MGLVLLPLLGFWHGWRAWRDPLVWMLHMGLFWLALALLLRVGALYQLLPASMAYHALTKGSIGGMILSIITRVPLVKPFEIWQPSRSRVDSLSTIKAVDYGRRL